MCATHHEITHHASCVSLSRCPSLLPSPMGRLLTRFPRLSLAQLRLSLRSTTVCTCLPQSALYTAPLWLFPIALVRDSPSALCLQGGGVYVQSGIVTISSSSIYENTAWQGGGGVYVNLQQGGTVSIVNCRVYSNQAQYVRASHAFKTPSLYFTCFALVLAVWWRCLCLLRHSHD